MEEKNTAELVPQFVQILFKSRQKLSQLYRLMDSHIAELYIMMLIDNQDEEHKLYAVDIQDKLSASKAAISNALLSLERQGFLERRIDADNRRKMSLTLTDSGKKELELYKEPFNNLMIEILEDLGYDDAASLIGLLDKLSEVLEDIYTEKS